MAGVLERARPVTDDAEVHSPYTLAVRHHDTPFIRARVAYLVSLPDPLKHSDPVVRFVKDSEAEA